MDAIFNLSISSNGNTTPTVSQENGGLQSDESKINDLVLNFLFDEELHLASQYRAEEKKRNKEWQQEYNSSPGPTNFRISRFLTMNIDNQVRLIRTEKLFF